MREELRQRLATDYHYAVNKMQDSTQLNKKLFYFSILFSEAQRVLNLEWNRDLALIYTVTFYVHTQINAAVQTSGFQALPIDWAIVYDKLTKVSSDLATYFLKTEDNTEELHQILGSFAEITYVVSGNGSYLHEKGHITFEPNEPLQLV